MKRKILCECNSRTCREVIDIESIDYERINQAHQIVISNNCHHGPELTEILVARFVGYSVYMEIEIESVRDTTQSPPSS